MRTMADAEITPAPRLRQAAATAVDVAVAGGLWWLARKRGQLLTRRLQPHEDPEAKRGRDAFGHELEQIGHRHAGELATRDAEVRRHFLDHHPPPVQSQLLRAMAPTLAVGLLIRRLRRWLAPTKEILARRA